MPLEPLSPLCTFKNSTKCITISFDSDSFWNSSKVYDLTTGKDCTMKGWRGDNARKKHYLTSIYVFLPAYC